MSAGSSKRVIALAIDREQLKEDLEALWFPILLFTGGILGDLLAIASIEMDYLGLDVLYWIVVAAGALFLFGRLYDRYTVEENAEEGETK